jgi:hypothetical protein
MILKDYLYNTRQILSDNNIDDASLESELLIRQQWISAVFSYIKIAAGTTTRQAGHPAITH